MKIYPCLLKPLNVPSKKDYLYKDKSFYLSLEFKSNNSSDIYKLNDYQYVDFNPKHFDSVLNDNIRSDEEQIVISNILFSSDEKLSINYTNELKLSFINCVFIKWFQFIGNPKYLSFDNCVINEYPLLPSKYIDEIFFLSCSINKLSYSGLLKNFDISHSYINNLELIDIATDTFSMFFNKIDILDLERIDSNKIFCDPSQFISVNSNSCAFINKLKKLIQFAEIKKNRLYIKMAI